MPVVVAQILRLLNDSRSSASDLEKHFRQDPALAGKMLRMVNSSFFGFRQPISDLSHAAGILGYNSMRSLALAAWLGEFLNRPLPAYGYAKGGLWKHCLATASVARSAARLLPSESGMAEDLFTAGLLHDVGKLVLAEHADSTVSLASGTMSSAQDILEREQAHFGFDHAEVGGEIAGKWQLSPMLANVIRRHHDLGSDEDLCEQAAAVQLADWLCNVSPVEPADGDVRPFPSPDAALQMLRLDAADLDGLLQETRDVMQKVEDEAVSAL